MKKDEIVYYPKNSNSEKLESLAERRVMRILEETSGESGRDNRCMKSSDKTDISNSD